MAKKLMTEAESKIAAVLWAHPDMTMMEITRALEAETGWSKHTVTTLLKRMADKGTVRVDTSQGVRRYTAALPQSSVALEQTQALVHRMYGGKASELLKALVNSGSLSEQDLRQALSQVQENEAPPK